MVKTADVGLRAKARLARELATPMSEAAGRGEKAYLRGGSQRMPRHRASFFRS